MAARASAGRDVPPVAHVEPGVKTPAPRRDSGGNNSVVSAEIIQSFHSVKPAKTTEKPKRQNSASDDEWRFEIKRKRRDAGRKNTGSTARAGWYYWVIRVRRSDGATLYYGTLDVLDADNPERLQKYWKRSAKRKVGKNA
jgi:hypothetical protein